jgi:hypothetical protein
MWRGYLLVAVAGCGFTTVRPSSDPVPDGGTSGTWMFDTAVDFAAPGSLSTDMTIDARGSLTPNAYSYGGLVAHGMTGAKLWSGTDTSWARVDGAQVSGIALWCGEHIASTTRIEYLGIPSDSQQMSVWFEGEVWLEATPSERFLVNGDDIAFVDLAPPGTKAYARIVSGGSMVQAPVAVPVSGWYPIRIGFADGNKSRDFDFTHTDSGATFVHWTRDRLRARTSELAGVMSTVFFHQILGGGDVGQMPVPRFEPGDLMTQTMLSPLPPGAPSNGDDWSAHFAGQVYIAEPGPYTLVVTSDDGNRVRLAAAAGSMNWARGSNTANAVTTLPTMLDAGWNDVVVDYNQTMGGRKLIVGLGPDATPAVAIPRSQLRPVDPGNDRLAFGADDSPHRVQDSGGPGTATMRVAGYAGETVAAIDLTVQLNSPHWDHLKLELERPGAAPITIRDRVVQPGDGRQLIALSIPSGPGDPLAALLGGPAGGDWRLRVDDVVPTGGDSTIELARVTLHTTGGPDKVARSASWTSPVLDATTRVFAIDSLTWDDRLPPGSSLQVSIRACAQPDCSDGLWSAVSNTQFTIGPGRYLQVRVDMTSNGVLEPELRSLTIVYRRDLG